MAPSSRPAPRPTPRRALPGARERARVVVERLREEYPEAVTELVHADPYQLLTATILSAQTTDVRVNLVTPALFARYPTAADLAGAEPAEVEELIRSTGFFRQKARAIVAMARDVVARHGGEVPTTLAELTSLRGVGRKTANVVLGSAFALPGLAVDTHVRRLSNRLRLTRSLDPPVIEREVGALVPAAEWSALGHRLILHGRRVCTARAPRHDACVLADICPSVDLDPSAWRTPGASRGRRPPRAGAG